MKYDRTGITKCGNERRGQEPGRRFVVDYRRGVDVVRFGMGCVDEFTSRSMYPKEEGAEVSS